MKAERIQELALQALNFERDAGVPGVYVENAIRLAIAERDREVAEWAKDHQHDCGEYMERSVMLTPLIAFLEAQP